MVANEFAPTDYLEILDEDQDGKAVAHIPLGEAAIPRAGEWITLRDEGETAGAIFEVKWVHYHYGRRWKSNDTPCLLKVTVYVKG